MSRWGTMAIMTAQLPLMLVPAGAVQIGEISALVEDETGGRVFIRGELVFAWNAGDEFGRRLAAVQLVAIKGARAVRRRGARGRGAGAGGWGGGDGRAEHGRALGATPAGYQGGYPVVGHG